MTPLLLFLLGLASVYVSTVTTAFSALMRLSLRLMAERGGRDDALRRYLEDPLRLYIPARVLLALFAVLSASLLARVTGVDAARGLPLLVVSMVIFVLFFEHIVPLALVRRHPERTLALLLPSFEAIVRVLKPLTAALIRLGVARRDRVPAVSTTTEEEQPETEQPETQPEDHEHLQEGQARELLRSLVEFRETMAREVMTPRPDIVAIGAQATLAELQTLVREQQYSRIPVYRETLDNIIGFISIKDLILLSNADPAQSIIPLVRPAYFVPETKRVPELLKEFQRKRVQAAIVVDEYGGTAGLVTLEDLLEEIVGEIRDEYDVESEAVLEETDGSFVFSGRTHIRELAERLKVEVGEGEGYETVGGYLLAHVGRVPTVGETFELGGLSVEVLEAERRRITRVRVRRREDVPVAVSEPAE
ncbi:MAG TPA: hemolysin family protein [Vicinamibacterales bacterium]|nr:hemolysin family protein [Vicinamibacterales bacterium]